MDKTLAGLKGTLAGLGHDMMPGGDFEVRSVAHSELEGIIVLDRVRHAGMGWQPDYDTVGFADCAGCDMPCWLGHGSARVMDSCMNMLAICHSCLDEAPQAARDLVIHINYCDH